MTSERRSPAPPAGPWEGVVVVMATSFWDGTPLLERHLANELTAYAPILYVEPPISLLTRMRNREVARTAPKPGLRFAGPNLALLTVRLPPLKDRVWAKPVSLVLLRRALRRALRGLGSPDVAAMVVTSLDPVLGAIGERLSVYYAKDDYVAGAELLGLPAGAVDDYVSRLCASAGLVVAVSPTLAATLAARGVHPVVIPNGCDVSLFSRTTVPASTAGPRAAFVGHLSDRVDVSLLQAVVDAGVHLRLVGPVQETMSGGYFDALLGHERVEWLGPQPHSALPELLSEVTACLLPYRDTEFNRASFPLKALEYLAAGRRVVGTDLPALRWLDTDLVASAGDTSSFVEAVLQSLATPLGAEEVAARREFAAGHTWQRRARTFAAAAGLVPGPEAPHAGGAAGTTAAAGSTAPAGSPGAPGAL